MVDHGGGGWIVSDVTKVIHCSIDMMLEMHYLKNRTKLKLMSKWFQLHSTLIDSHFCSQSSLLNYYHFIFVFEYLGTKCGW